MRSFLRSVIDEEAVVELADVAGVEPAVRVDRLGGRLGLVVVALHDVRAARQDLAVLGDLHLDARHRPPDRAEAPAAAAVDADDRRGLRQAVALVDLHAGADEELRELARERRAARDREAEVASRARARIFLKTSASAIFAFRARPEGSGSPRSRYATPLRARRRPPSAKSFFFRALPASAFAMILAWTFS